MAVLFESCVDSLEAAVASARGGAGRIELCAHLEVGGTTPDAALIAACADAVAIPVFVMVRPRGGDFVYDAGELSAMAADIRAAAAAGAHGVVFGALRPEGTIDDEAMRRLIAAAKAMPVTCHKAIDATRDVAEALDALLALGVDRVLTSGGALTADDGAATIAAMVARAGGALAVMAGGAVRADTVADLVNRTGVREVHARLIPSGVPPPIDDATLDQWAADVHTFVAHASAR
jgi:copper homeostasis protein